MRVSSLPTAEEALYEVVLKTTRGRGTSGRHFSREAGTGVGQSSEVVRL